MTDRQNLLLSEPITMNANGDQRILNTLDDGRRFISLFDPLSPDEELRQAAVTAIEKAATSGAPSDVSLATEQLKLLIRSMA